mgnify:CR=1 FL=1
MEKLTGLKKTKTAVFISGKGSNLKNLINFTKIKNTPISINLIVSNTHLAKGLKFADQFKIKKKIFNFKNPENTEKKILLLLKKEKIKFICLAGFMKILSKEFIRKFNGVIINIHPSLLPKYKGTNTFKRILKNREIMTGCTVHYVNDKLDSGKIIIKKKFNLSHDDNEASLKRKTQILEYRAFSEAISKIYK